MVVNEYWAFQVVTRNCIHSFCVCCAGGFLSAKRGSRLTRGVRCSRWANTLSCNKVTCPEEDTLDCTPQIFLSWCPIGFPSHPMKRPHTRSPGAGEGSFCWWLFLYYKAFIFRMLEQNPALVLRIGFLPSFMYISLRRISQNFHFHLVKSLKTAQTCSDVVNGMALPENEFCAFFLLEFTDFNQHWTLIDHYPSN